MTSTVAAAAVSKNFGAYQDAAVREPVIITKNGRPRTVLIAYEDYLRLSRRDAELAAVEKAEQEPCLDHLNAELLADKQAAD
ncbi:type II toxin-antitoxin system Phd/YefM family antitoxin [Sinorhizobium americanum]|uniref:Antitoxin n=1 Tax=Sinorhizobium americanum TaxID=194963 RepID=A0A4R2BYM1_9HYPH|nr:type II toxin-antitoxin system Phd/YefM family antitoxin [Sinorhizobium americanum]TCN32991.1 prevent-host-death family protein [Sinorhizobium americanum]